MNMSLVDLAVIVVFFLLVVAIGASAVRRASKSTEDFFLSGRSMPWWLLGVSIVACTFSCDTPNLVTDIVRNRGVAGNWVWWAFLLTGMLTVFVYAKLWRRSRVMTDLEIYEIRYGGKPAALLRGFRALYLGVFFNCMIMGTVTLAAIKIGQVMFGLSPLQAIVYSSIGVVVYATLGGITGCIWADFFQYSWAMAGAILAAVYALRLPEVGGLHGLLANPAVSGKIGFFPDLGNHAVVIELLVLPLAIQWWSTWYPGAEPGGGGYVAQRMLTAKNERHAIGGTLLFNILHYAMRPWPWILVALASLIVFPDLAAIKARYPNIADQYLRHDIAYPAMMFCLPKGILGMMVASLVAAYMSTIATHLTWGSSYMVNDFYRRFLRPTAPDRELVWVGRISMVLLMALAGGVALILQNAKGAFDILLQIGAGTGLIYILRWFWWRINVWTEIAGMVISFAVALFFQFGLPQMGLPEGHWLLASHWKLIVGVGITTVGWLAVTLLTPPVDTAVLKKFYRLTRPGGAGWREIDALVVKEGGQPVREKFAVSVLCIFLGCVTVYGALFGLGFWLRGNALGGTVATLLAIAGGIALFKAFSQIQTDME